MKDICFLVLHYLTIEDTKKCITSIENLVGTDSYQIVVVDNASPNNSGEELQNLYMNDEHIHIILSKENLGFANGNNLGFKYIKEKCHPKFICMLNNDVEILTEDFYNEVNKKYSEYNFAVLGPKIYLPNNQINPIQEKIISYKVLKKDAIKWNVFSFLCTIGLYGAYENLKQFIKKNIIKDVPYGHNLYNKNVDTIQKNVVLHGCCWIFSPIYIKKFDGIDDRTFMYLEEKLLAVRLKKEKMTSLYCPSIKIFHNEDSSTKQSTKSSRKKYLFLYRNAAKSAKVLLKELKDLDR